MCECHWVLSGTCEPAPVDIRRTHRLPAFRRRFESDSEGRQGIGQPPLCPMPDLPQGDRPASVHFAELRQATPRNQTRRSGPLKAPNLFAFICVHLRLKFFFVSPPYSSQCLATKLLIPIPDLRRGMLRRITVGARAAITLSSYSWKSPYRHGRSRGKPGNVHDTTATLAHQNEKCWPAMAESARSRPSGAGDYSPAWVTNLVFR
jgi:hypothetical protein